MEFTIGSAVFLSSLLLLAILARMAAANPDPALLRGEIVPALLSVVFTSGLTVGLVMMGLGGEGHFGSPAMESLAIIAFAIVSVWIITRLVVRAPRARQANPA